MPGHTRHMAAGKHVMDSRITVEDGGILAGEYFPMVHPQ